MQMAPGSPGAVDPTANLGEAVKALAAEGYGWVVLHPDLLTLPESRYFEAINPLLGEPSRLGTAWVWELPGAVGGVEPVGP